MVKGDCRIIPALKGDIKPPPELEGMIFADFRRSFKKGIASVLKALNREADNAVVGSWAELDSLIEEVFDHSGFASMLADYKSEDYRYVLIEGLRTFDRGDDADIVYETVHDYLGKAEPLTERWWREYKEVQQRYGQLFHFVASERPVSIPLLEPSVVSPNVKSRVELSEYFQFIVVFADLSRDSSPLQKRETLEAAKHEFIRIGTAHGLYSMTAK
jgi:hypothetical protein